ncbi:MAG: DUF1549 domain-containing protein [Verrucomicrobiales bacterium]|nr:DUF1549 domain-containing protein [Verrucomicrobiales bacterium]
MSAAHPGGLTPNRLASPPAHLSSPFLRVLSSLVRVGLAVVVLGWVKSLCAAEAAPASGPATTEEGWWAFRPLQSPSLPAVTRAGWVQSPVDRFLLAGLERGGVQPVSRAEPRVLLRRLALDLHGLPPEPEEVEAFEQDPSPRAWAGWVSRYLERPAYGERWARHWLDVARFAESSGFEHDYDRPHAYHFRDFVIRALNADLPFDQFARWQVAGDELAPEDPEALMATGFLGAGVFPTQITANEVERTRYDAMDDMLSTTASAFLGLTVGCARCHDHKSDPISSDEYYRLLSVFTTTVRSEVERDLDPERTRRERAEYELAHAPLVEAVQDYERTVLPTLFDRWLADPAATPPAPAWQSVVFDSATSKGGATFAPQSDGSYLVQGAKADHDQHEFTWTARGQGYRALRVEALPDPSLAKGGPGRADNGNFALSRLRVRVAPLTGGDAVEVALTNPRADFQQNAEGLSVAAALDEQAATGWAVDPKFGERHAAVFDFAHPVGFEGGTRFTVVLEYATNTRHQIGRPRLSLATDASLNWDGDDVPAPVAGALATLREASSDRATAVAALRPEDRRELLAWWKRSEPGWRERQQRVEEHARTAPQPKLTKILMCGEGHTPVRMHTQGADFFPETHVLSRGSTEQKRGVASPGFLRVLMKGGPDMEPWAMTPPPGARYSGRRTALARWLTDVDRGGGALLARVIVNRLWQHHFGRGLVSTPNDFGRQGARPSHPELLEWLASELVRQGWRLKPLHELILTSAAYQLASSPSDPADPTPLTAVTEYRRFVARRLEGEVIRDSALAVCGVLDRRPFGPGTLDEASRRRSIYFTVKRSQLVSAMQAFDAPEPLVSQGARPTTTVAPQALFLMNNPNVRTWALAGAESFLSGGGESDDNAIRALYRRALGRPPTSAEFQAAREFLSGQTANYRPDASDRARLLALADLLQVVMSLNEFSYVE